MIIPFICENECTCVRIACKVDQIYLTKFKNRYMQEKALNKQGVSELEVETFSVI